MVSPCLCQALPLCKCAPDSPNAAGKQAIIWLDQNTVCMRLLRRKNRPKGSGVMKRLCTCRANPHTCLVHMLWDKFLAALPEGTHPWAHITAGAARSRLRRILELLKVPGASMYGTHDLRRGHAEDMRESGCTLAEILAAGQWKTSAFLNYLNEVRLRCHMQHSHKPLVCVRQT
jgi:hypothetical protein